MNRTRLTFTTARNRSFFWALPAVLWQVLFLYVPLVFVLGSSFFHSWQAWQTSAFTFDNYKALASWAHVSTVLWSLMIASITTCVCLLISYPVAYVLALRVTRFRNFLLFLLTLPFWTNFLVQAYAWFFVLDPGGLVNRFLLTLGLISQPLHILYSTFAVLLVMVYCYLPFMLLPLYTGIERLDPTLFEAARDLGADQFQTFMRITLPLTRSAVRTGFLLVFVPAFGEYVIPTILGGNKFLYVGTMITDYFLVAQQPARGAAFTCVSVLVMLGVVAVTYWFLTPSFSLVREDES